MYPSEMLDIYMHICNGPNNNVNMVVEASGSHLLKTKNSTVKIMAGIRQEKFNATRSIRFFNASLIFILLFYPIHFTASQFKVVGRCGVGPSRILI